MASKKPSKSFFSNLLFLPALWFSVAIVVSALVLGTTYLAGVDRQLEFQAALIKLQISMSGINR